MNFGLGVILLLVAVVLFVLGALSDTNYTEFTGLGLAAFAGSFLATSLGWADRTFGSSGSSGTSGP
jgi:drug/metabolite transporter superfamily protein YnfA